LAGELIQKGHPIGVHHPGPCSKVDAEFFQLFQNASLQTTVESVHDPTDTYRYEVHELSRGFLTLPRRPGENLPFRSRDVLEEDVIQLSGELADRIESGLQAPPGFLDSP
jgi:hypothetical protein